MQTSCRALTWQKGAGELCGASFIRALTLLIRASPSELKHFPKAPSPNTITLGIRISTYESWGHTNIQTIAEGIAVFLGDSHLLFQRAYEVIHPTKEIDGGPWRQSAAKNNREIGMDEWIDRQIDRNTEIFFFRSLKCFLSTDFMPGTMLNVLYT